MLDILLMINKLDLLKMMKIFESLNKFDDGDIYSGTCCKVCDSLHSSRLADPLDKEF